MYSEKPTTTKQPQSAFNLCLLSQGFMLLFILSQILKDKVLNAILNCCSYP